MGGDKVIIIKFGGEGKFDTIGTKVVIAIISKHIKILCFRVN